MQRSIKKDDDGGAREFRMRDGDFRSISKLIYANAGIIVDENKKELVYARIARRLRRLGLTDFGAYMSLMESPEGEKELGEFINALTTNHTFFFREGHHFDYIRDTMIPYWKQRAARTGDKKLRIWSTASSSGEEPYSLAMTIAHGLGDGWDWRILATDIDTQVLRTAKIGQYGADVLNSIPKTYQNKYLEKAGPDHFRIVEPLRSRISFNRLNLHGNWPVKGQFDMIMCRNVVIYFNAEDKARLVRRLCDTLKPDAWFFLGHSEALLSSESALKLVGRTIYAVDPERTKP